MRTRSRLKMKSGSHAEQSDLEFYLLLFIALSVTAAVIILFKPGCLRFFYKPKVSITAQTPPTPSPATPTITRITGKTPPRNKPIASKISQHTRKITSATNPRPLVKFRPNQPKNRLLSAYTEQPSNSEADAYANLRSLEEKQQKEQKLKEYLRYTLNLNHTAMKIISDEFKKHKNEIARIEELAKNGAPNANELKDLATQRHVIWMTQFLGITDYQEVRSSIL